MCVATIKFNWFNFTYVLVIQVVKIKTILIFFKLFSACTCEDSFLYVCVQFYQYNHKNYRLISLVWSWRSSFRIFCIVLYSFSFLFVYELNASFVPILYCSYFVQFIYLEMKYCKSKETNRNCRLSYYWLEL